MSPKAFLNRAFYINQRINSKVEQIASLNALANKVTTTYSQAPASGSHNNHKMEDIIIKIVAMEEDINSDIDELLDIKAEIIGAINAVENEEHRTILEKRYLSLESWEDIAADMNYGVRNVFILHGKALKSFAKAMETLQ